MTNSRKSSVWASKWTSSLMIS